MALGGDLGEAVLMPIFEIDDNARVELIAEALAALTGTQALNRENLGDAVVDQMRNLALDVERFLIASMR
jgi:hypothetical protein